MIREPRRSSCTSHVAVTAVALALALVLPGLALAAGPDTVPPGATEDPFTGAPPAAAPRIVGAGGFRFYGSGFGHGMGMSQWGANGLAQMGWSHKRIVKHFYRGTRVRRLGDPVRKIRVGLTWDRTRIHVRAKDGPVRLWVRQSPVVGVSAASPRDARGSCERRRAGSRCATSMGRSWEAVRGAGRRST